jgi:hypothetical protein
VGCSGKLRIKRKAAEAQLVEQPMCNAPSLAYVVVEYGWLKVVFVGSGVSPSMLVQRFVQQFLLYKVSTAT